MARYCRKYLRLKTAPPHWKHVMCKRKPTVLLLNFVGKAVSFFPKCCTKPAACPCHPISNAKQKAKMQNVTRQFLPGTMARLRHLQLPCILRMGFLKTWKQRAFTRNTSPC